MWSRRDQIQAYQFLRRRIVSAVLVGDANHAESPTRLQSRSTIGGFVVMTLLLAGFGIFGLLRPGSSTSWQSGKAIVEEKDSGGLFVLLEDDDGVARLHPVLNYASARLIVGGGDLIRQSARSLDAAPRGSVVGISGAPDSLPAADRISHAPWISCTTLDDPISATHPTTTLLVDGSPPVSIPADPGPVPSPVKAATPLADGDAILATDGARTFLVTGGTRYEVAARHLPEILRALGLDISSRLLVASSWLEALPAGPTLDYPSVPGLGERSRVGPFPQSRVGQIYTEDPQAVSDPRYFQLERDGLAPISPLQARLALANQAIRAAYRQGSPASFVSLSVTDISNLPASGVDREPSHYPSAQELALAVTIQDHDRQLCAAPSAERFDPDGAWAFDLTVVSGNPVSTGDNPMAAPDNGTGNRVIGTKSGWGALVRSVSQQSHQDGPVYLVTDQGLRFAVPDTDAQSSALAALGYGGVAPDVVPDRFLTVIPEGPPLDPAAALIPKR